MRAAPKARSRALASVAPPSTARRTASATSRSPQSMTTTPLSLTLTCSRLTRCRLSRQKIPPPRSRLSRATVPQSTEKPPTTSLAKRCQSSSAINFPCYAGFNKVEIRDGSIIVDLCSSWISHLPQDKKFFKVIGIGMNESELAANKNLNEHYVHDLNSPIHKDRLLPMLKDASVDHVICAVSIDYIIQPHHLFEEVLRILRPSSGSTFIISFSNRCFPTKVIRAWLQTDDVGRIGIVCSYFQETKQSFDNKWKHITVYDLSNEERDNHPSSPNYSDPLFVVMGEKA